MTAYVTVGNTTPHLFYLLKLAAHVSFLLMRPRLLTLMFLSVISAVGPLHCLMEQLVDSGILPVSGSSCPEHRQTDTGNRCEGGLCGSVFIIQNKIFTDSDPLLSIGDLLILPSGNQLALAGPIKVSMSASSFGGRPPTRMMLHSLTIASNAPPESLL